MPLFYKLGNRSCIKQSQTASACNVLNEFTDGMKNCTNQSINSLENSSSFFAINSTSTSTSAHQNSHSSLIESIRSNGDISLLKPYVNYNHNCHPIQMSMLLAMIWHHFWHLQTDSK